MTIRTFILHLICLISASAYGHEHTVYVSPNGDDSLSGETATEAVLSIRRAMEIADAHPAESVNIYLDEGNYRLDGPIVISGRRSATLSLHGRGMGRTVISGACTLPKFRPVSPTLWAIPLDGTLAAGADIQQLYVDGRRAIPARTPNHGLPLWRTRCVTQTVADSVPPRGAIRKGLAVHAVRLTPEAFGAMTSLSGPAEDVRSMHGT